MLPVPSGWAILEELRRGGKQTPVLFLTARDAVQDRVKGLELGADDYLIKPFAFSELLARVRLLLRRAPARHAERLQVADLEVDWFHQRPCVRQAAGFVPERIRLLSLFVRPTREHPDWAEQFTTASFSTPPVTIST